MVLSDVHSLQVVAMIGEQDAARMQPSQAAMVSVDAVPGVHLPAAVLAVGPNGTVLQNVTNYLATLVLQDSDRRLKAGMTASAAVVVTELDDVLQIPNAAIHRSGGGNEPVGGRIGSGTSAHVVVLVSCFHTSEPWSMLPL